MADSATLPAMVAAADNAVDLAQSWNGHLEKTPCHPPTLQPSQKAVLAVLSTAPGHLRLLQKRLHASLLEQGPMLHFASGCWVEKIDTDRSRGGAVGVGLTWERTC